MEKVVVLSMMVSLCKVIYMLSLISDLVAQEAAMSQVRHEIQLKSHFDPGSFAGMLQFETA